MAAAVRLPPGVNGRGLAPRGRFLLPPDPRPLTIFQRVVEGHNLKPHIQGSAGYDGVQDLSAGVFRAYDFAMPAGSALLVPAVGFQTVLAGPTGYQDAKDALKKAKAAERIGDRDGVWIERGNALKFVAIAGLGAVAAPYRTLTIASAVQNIDVSASAPLMGRVTYGLGQTFNGLLTLLYVFGGIVSGYRLYRVNQWRSHLSKAFLDEQLSEVSVGDIEGNALDWREVARKQGALWLKKMYKEMDRAKVLKNPHLSKALREDKAEAFFEEHAEELKAELKERFGEEIWEQCLERAGGDVVAAFGLGLKREFAEAVKHQEAERILGADLLKELKEKGTTDEMVEKVKSHLNWGVAREVFFFILSLAGLAMGILGFIPKAIFNIASSIIWGVTSAIYFLFDLKSFGDWWKSGDVGKSEKWMIALSMVLTVISIVAICAVATYFTGPLWLLVLALMLDGAWMALNVAALYKVWNHDLEKPTVDSLSNRIKHKMGDDLARKVFAKFSEEDRVAMHKILRKDLYCYKSDDKLTEGDIEYAVHKLQRLRLQERMRMLRQLRNQLADLM